jgi:exodeoxyribonuclease VII small subunit
MKTQKKYNKIEATRTFESCVTRLESIVSILEQGEVPLEESVKFYEEGIELSKICLERLTEAELKIKKISKDLNGNIASIQKQDKD